MPLFSDPIKGLQAAAAIAATHVSPGNPARQVVVLDAQGTRLLTLAVPPGVSEDTGEFLRPATGWHITDHDARYDGRPIAVGPSRLKLLKVLAAADGALMAKDLARLAFDRETDEENARYHVKQLRKELGTAFDGFEGEIVANDGGGYRLILR